MTTEQFELYNEIKAMQQQVSQHQFEYWQVYSGLSTWQFWLIFSMFLLPLIWLYFTIDRSKIFQLGFYGLNVHIWFVYINIIGERWGFWGYPYQLMPFLPTSYSLDASLAPVIYMLVYQWVLNKNKNFYLYSFLVSALFAFGIKPLLSALNFFKLKETLTYIHVFFIYTVIFLIATVITKAFLTMQRKQTN